MATTKTPSGFINFSDITLVIQQLIDDWNVELLDITLSPKKYAYKMSPTKGECTLGGIQFKIRLRGRPANEKVLMNILQAASQEQGTSVSAAQCRAALMKWMFDESERIFVEQFGTIKGKNLFCIDDYDLEDDI